MPAWGGDGPREWTPRGGGAHRQARRLPPPDGRQLAHGGDAGHDLRLQLGRRGDRGGSGKPGTGRLEFSDLLRTGFAGLQMLLERLPLGGWQGVQGVGTAQGVVVGHACTPRQSRRRISPSRILVLTVPSGTARTSATSR